jgi:hypothetical protein
MDANITYSNLESLETEVLDLYLCTGRTVTAWTGIWCKGKVATCSVASTGCTEV